MSKKKPQQAAKQPPATNRGVNSRTATKILSFGVDWLTCTTRSEAVQTSWFEWYGRLTRDQMDTNGPGKASKRLGYDGWLLADNTFVGTGYDGKEALWISSGASAQRDWQMVGGPAHRISRIDLQVTCQLRRPRYQNIARDVYANRDLSRLLHTYIISEDCATCYVGSRHSDWFGRVYDKSKSYDALPGSTWRYEVVSKNKDINSQLMVQMQDASNALALHDFVCGFVWQWFQKRSCNPAFTTASPITIVTETGVNLYYPDRQLAWLRAGVAPVINRLARDGFMNRALEALGLVAEEMPLWGDVELEIGEKV